MKLPRTTPSFGWILLTAVLLGSGLCAVVSGLPLPPRPPVAFLSDYGASSDNRRLLLMYGALVLAVTAAPFVAAWLFPGKLRPGIPDDPPPPARRTADRFPALRFLLFAGAALLLFVGPGIAWRALNEHELVHLGYLNEIGHGRLLGADTRITYGPFLGYVIFAFMRLTSFTIYGFRLYSNVSTALLLAAVCAAAWPRFKSRALFGLFVAAALLDTVARYFLPNEHGVNGGFWGWTTLLRQGWAPLTLLLLAGPLAAGRTRGPLVAAGVVFALGASYGWETAVPAIVAFAALIGLGGGRLAPFLAGAAAGMAAMLMPIVIRGGLGPAARTVLEVPRLFLAGGGNLPYLPLLGHGRSAFVTALPHYLVPAGLLAGFLFLWSRVLAGSRRWNLEFALAVYGVISFVNSLVRGRTPHLLNILLAPLLVTFLLADRWSTTWRRRLLPVAAGLALLSVMKPGLPDLYRGIRGRLHVAETPGPGWEKIPLERAGIWTPADNWFDNRIWGEKDDPAAVPMIRALTEGRPTVILGPKASLYYFLADVPCAISWTDLHSQCFTPDDFRELRREMIERRPEYLFVAGDASLLSPPEWLPYRALGLHHGFFVFQRTDLEPPLRID